MGALNRMGDSRMGLRLADVAAPFGHSWPWEIGHWWLTLTAADQGAWISGAGSFAAAIVALHLARKASKREERRDIARARLAAAHLYYPITHIRAALEVIADEIPPFASVLAGAASRNVVNHAALIRSACTKTMPRVQAFKLADAAALPADVGEDLASAVALTNFIFERLEIATRTYFKADDFKDADQRRFEAASGCAELTPMVRHTISKTNSLLVYCRDTFGTQNLR